MIKNIKDRYADIHITLVSVLLGLALADLIATFRSLNDIGVESILITIEIILLIINAWIAYSTYSLVTKVMPSFSDVFSAFGLGAIHFLLNSTLGNPIHHFFMAFSLYNVIGASITYYNLNRLHREIGKSKASRSFNKVIGINIFGFVLFGFIAVGSYFDYLTESLSYIFVGLSIFLTITWIYLYRRSWERLLLPRLSDQEYK